VFRTHSGRSRTTAHLLRCSRSYCTSRSFFMCAI